MRKFSIMLLVLCAVAGSLVGCHGIPMETEELALNALATEEGWTVTHKLWFSGTRAHIVRVKNTENPKKGVLIQVCVSTRPVTRKNLKCFEDDEVFFPQ